MYSKKWTPEEINFLINANNLSDQEISKKLNRTVTSIRSQRKALRKKYGEIIVPLKQPKGRVYPKKQSNDKVKPWTEEELIILNEHFELEDEELAELLDRPIRQVKRKRKRLDEDYFKYI